jgi:glycosyltransferase involved in cell wall biosynthesis
LQAPDSPTAIVIPALNEADNLGALLDDCARQEPAPAEVIVVDAGSTDGTAELVTDRARHWTALALVAAPGAPPGAARNVGIRAAASRVIATVDGGSRLDPGWLSALVTLLAGRPESHVVVGTSEPDPRSNFERAAGWLTVRAFKPPDRSGPIGNSFRPAGRNGYCFTKEAWAAAGEYPEDLQWGEDKVFLERLRSTGREVVVTTGAVVRWRPRGSLRALWRQYANYGRADAMAKIDRQNELVPLALYGAGLVLATLAATTEPLAGVLLIAGVVAYLGLFVVAAAREVRPLRALLWVPVIRVTTDLAKMQGFLAWTFAGRRATR